MKTPFSRWIRTPSGFESSVRIVQLAQRLTDQPAVKQDEDRQDDDCRNARYQSAEQHGGAQGCPVDVRVAGHRISVRRGFDHRNIGQNDGQKDGDQADHRRDGKKYHQQNAASPAGWDKDKRA